MAEKGRLLADQAVGFAEMKKKRIEYEAQREAYLNSPRGKFDQEVRAVTQKASNTEELAYETFIKAISVLKVETLELIVKCLEEHAEGEEIKNLDVKHVKFALEKCNMALVKLKGLCENEIYIKHKNVGIYSEYDRLFNTLMDKVNIRFAFFAPALSLSRKSIRFSKMSTAERNAMFKHLKSLGLTENEEYMQAYYDVFEQQIEQEEAVGV